MSFRASGLDIKAEVLAVLKLKAVLPLPSMWPEFHPEGSCCENTG